MTLEQLNRQNQKFQKEAGQLAEMVPGGNMVEFSSLMIRGAKKIDGYLKKLISSKSKQAFYTNLDKMEEEMDDIIFMLDRLDEANRARKIKFIDAFTKKGYELLSVYSICCDQLIGKVIRKTEETE